MGNSWKVLVAERVKQEGLFFHLTQMKSCYISTLLFLFFHSGKITGGNSAHSKARSIYWVCSKSVYAHTPHFYIEQSSFWAWLKWHRLFSVFLTPAKYTVLGFILDSVSSPEERFS